MHESDHGRMTTFRMQSTSPLTDVEERLISSTIGCAIAVHKELGPGFLESIYRRAMTVELDARGLPFATEVPVTVNYKGTEIAGQRMDLVVGGRIVVELKSVVQLDQIHRAQVISYLRATGLRGALLINFRVPILPKGLQRIVL